MGIVTTVMIRFLGGRRDREKDERCKEELHVRVFIFGRWFVFFCEFHSGTTEIVSWKTRPKTCRMPKSVKKHLKI